MPKIERSNVVSGAEGGVGGVSYVDVQLTNAQIKALPNAGATILAAPGAGLTYLIHAVFFIFDTRGGAYTNVSAGNNPPAQVYLVTDPSASFDQITNGVRVATAYATPGLHRAVDSPILRQRDAATSEFMHAITWPGNWDNQPVELWMDNNDGGFLGDLTGGHASNTLSVRVWFSVVPAVPFGA